MGHPCRSRPESLKSIAWLSWQDLSNRKVARLGKPGLVMILDPFGEVLAESHALEDDVVVGLLTPERIANASGQRYLKA